MNNKLMNNIDFWYSRLDTIHEVSNFLDVDIEELRFYYKKKKYNYRHKHGRD